MCARPDARRQCVVRRVLRRPDRRDHPQGQQLHVFALPTVSTYAYAPTAQALTYGPDGNVWFLDTDNGRDRPRSPPSGTFTMYGVPGGLAISGSSLTAGPDGALSFTGTHARTRSGASPSTERSPSTRSPATRPHPASIATGPDGNLWIASTDSRETDGRELITRITPSDLTPIPWPKTVRERRQRHRRSRERASGRESRSTATDAQFTGASAISRQWLRCTTRSGPTEPGLHRRSAGRRRASYHVTPADVGDTLAFQDTAANPAGDTVVVDSATTAAVAPAVASRGWVRGV